MSKKTANRTLALALLLALLAWAPRPALAQRDEADSLEAQCGQLLRDLSLLYEQGQYVQMAAAAESRPNQCRYSREEKALIFRLLASAYYELDEQELANFAFYSYLRKNPHARPSGLDPLPFTKAFENFTVRPQFALTFRAGLSVPRFLVQKTYPIWEAADYGQAYQGYPTLTTEILLRWTFSRFSSLYLGQMPLSTISYGRTIESASSGFRLEYEETREYFTFPLLFELSPMRWRLRPSVQFGFFVSYLLNDRIDLDSYARTQAEDGTSSWVLASTATQQMQLDNAARLYFGLAYGVELAYRIGSYELLLGARNLTQPYDLHAYESRFQDQDFLFSHAYVHDTAPVSTWNYYLGLSFTFKHKVKYSYGRILNARVLENQLQYLNF